MFFKKKKIDGIKDREVEIVQVWIVTWYSTHYHTSNFCGLSKEYEAFTNEQEAIKFVEDLKTANKLLRNSFNIEVTIKKQ